MIFYLDALPREQQRIFVKIVFPYTSEHIDMLTAVNSHFKLTCTNVALLAYVGYLREALARLSSASITIFTEAPTDDSFTKLRMGMSVSSDYVVWAELLSNANYFLM